MPCLQPMGLVFGITWQEEVTRYPVKPASRFEKFSIFIWVPITVSISTYVYYVTSTGEMTNLWTIRVFSFLPPGPITATRLCGFGAKGAERTSISHSRVKLRICAQTHAIVKSTLFPSLTRRNRATTTATNAWDIWLQCVFIPVRICVQKPSRTSVIAHKCTVHTYVHTYRYTTYTAVWVRASIRNLPPWSSLAHRRTRMLCGGNSGGDERNLRSVYHPASFLMLRLKTLYGGRQSRATIRAKPTVFLASIPRIGRVRLRWNCPQKRYFNLRYKIV